MEIETLSRQIDDLRRELRYSQILVKRWLGFLAALLLGAQAVVIGGAWWLWQDLNGRMDSEYAELARLGIRLSADAERARPIQAVILVFRSGERNGYLSELAILDNDFDRETLYYARTSRIDQLAESAQLAFLNSDCSGLSLRELIDLTGAFTEEDARASGVDLKGSFVVHDGPDDCIAGLEQRLAAAGEIMISESLASLEEEITASSLPADIARIRAKIDMFHQSNPPR